MLKKVLIILFVLWAFMAIAATGATVLHYLQCRAMGLIP